MNELIEIASEFKGSKIRWDLYSKSRSIWQKHKSNSHRLKTKTLSDHEKVSNKLLKLIPVLHYQFHLKIFNDVSIKRYGDPCNFFNTSALSSLQQTISLVVYVHFTNTSDQLRYDGLPYKLYRVNCPHELVIFVAEHLNNRNEITHFSNIVEIEGVFWTDSISYLSLWNSSMTSFSWSFSYIGRRPCTTRPCLSMVASVWICSPNATNRPESIDSNPSHSLDWKEGLTK
jgi:hypothetical protein